MAEIKKRRTATPDEEDELRVIKACADGNWEEFSIIFEKYKDKVYFLAVSVVKERALALDVTQNTFIKVFRSLKHFNRRSRFSTWIFRIAYNQALDQYRKRRRWGEVEFSDALGSKISHASKEEIFQCIAKKELGDKIRAAVEQLPLKLRTAVVLKYVEGLTYSETCSILGCARGVLQKRLAQAGKKLREILKAEISELQD